MRFPHGKAQPQGAVTVSIGISAFAAEVDTPELMIQVADRALYLAKRRGKNRVEVFEPAAEISEEAGNAAKEAE